jgi:hypothetical protein
MVKGKAGGRAVGQAGSSSAFAEISLPGSSIGGTPNEVLSNQLLEGSWVRAGNREQSLQDVSETALL